MFRFRFAAHCRAFSFSNLLFTLRLKRCFAQITSLLLIITMLTVSTPAMTLSGAGFSTSLDEKSRDLRYLYESQIAGTDFAELAATGLDDYLPVLFISSNPLLALISGAGKIYKKHKNGKRGQQEQARPVRIEITPGASTVIREGEQITFSGIALDEKNQPVQGIEFKFYAIDARQKTPPLTLSNGVFAPLFPGDFLIGAEAAGLKTQTSVKVIKDTQAQLQKKQTLDRFRDEAEKAGIKPAEGERGVLSKEMEELAKIPLPEPIQTSSRAEQPVPVSALGKSQQKPLPVEKKAPPTTPFVTKEPGSIQASPADVQRMNNANQPRGAGGPNAGEEKTSEEKTGESAAAATAPFGTQPYGSADAVSSGRFLWGWSFDPDASANSNIIHFYINGPAGSGTFAGYTRANLPRADVNSGFGIAGNHGYEFDIPTYFQDGNWHTIYAYGIDETGDNPQLLGNSPVWFYFPAAGDPNWNDTNSNTADDSGQQPGSPPLDGTAGAGSGNFSLSVPVLSQPARGDIGINLSLNYNSLLWQQSNGEMTYDIDRGNPAPGWTVGLYGKMVDMGVANGGMIESPDGTRHSYDGSLQQSGTAGYSMYYAHTTDGSMIDYAISRTPSGISWAVAYFPNGTLISYGAANQGAAYPVYVKDRQGNCMVINYRDNLGPQIASIADDRWRQATFNYDANNHLVSIDGPAQNGGWRTLIRLHYKPLTLSYYFAGLTGMARHGTVDVIDAIYYPTTNTGYWFGDNDSYSSYGMIAKVMEQRAMSWSGANNNDQGTITAGNNSRQLTYNYPLAPVSISTAPQYTQTSESWFGMDTAAAVTTYNVQNNASPRTTAITLPNGNTIKQSSYNALGQWHDGLLYQMETLSPTNQVLGKTVTSWQPGDYGAPRVTDVYATDEKNQTTHQAFTYTGYYNQVSTAKDYGYASNLLRTKVNTYENGAGYTSWGRHIFSLVKTEELFDAANTRVSRSDYNYDQYALADTPGVVWHEEESNPYTTQTTQGANCVSWEYEPPVYGDPYQPYLVTGGDYYYCTQYDQVSVFNPSTNARGNLTQTISYADANALTGAITHDSTFDITGNARTITTDCCQQMSFVYTANTQYTLPESHTKGSSDPNSPDRMTESATYDFNTLLTTSSTDFNGRTSNYYYDGVNRLYQTSFPTGAHANTWYGDDYLVSVAHSYDAGGVRQHYQATWVNGRGQPVQTQLITQNPPNDQNPANWILTNSKYDQMGRLWQTTLPYTPGVSGQNWTTYAYDQLSRTTQVTAPDGSVAQNFYNETQRPDSATSAWGQTVRSRDAWGRERWARTDDFGRTAEVVEPNPGGTGSVFDAGSLQTVYNYDAKDQLLSTTQGVQNRWFAYDSLGRLIRQKLAEVNGSLTAAGQFDGGNGGWSDVFVYDARSNLIQHTDARGVKTNYSYNGDALNRLQQVSYDKTGADTTYAIADASPVNLSYMTSGDKTRVSTAQTWWTLEQNSYDVEGRISDYTINFPSSQTQPLTTSYLYDSLSRLTEVRYPASYGMAGNPRKVVTPTYDDTSRLKELKVDNQIQMSEIVYNPLSQVIQMRIAGATGNSDVETYAYDQQTGLMTGQAVIKANTNTQILNLSYEYNRGSSNGTVNGKTGQLTHIVNNLGRDKDRVFEYDTLGRLRDAKGGAATGVTGVTANWTQSYGYDRYGNRTNVTAAGITANSQAVPTDGLASQSYDASNNRINTAGYTYDLAGNLVRGQDAAGVWQQYDYDAAGRLTQVRRDSDGWIEQTNGYTSSRQRLLSWSYASALLTWYVWGGSSVISEYTSGGWGNTPLSWNKSYVYAGSRLLSTFTNNGAGGETLEFHHPDRLGTKLVTNDTANTSFEQSTLPFGTDLAAENVGTITTNQRFTSYDRSTVASLDYAVNRSYSSGQGRFTSVDPAQDGSNLYAYANNDPINFTDSTGLNASSYPSDPMGISYYVDGILSDARTAWAHLNGGGGYIKSYDTGAISGYETGAYENDQWVAQSRHYYFNRDNNQDCITNVIPSGRTDNDQLKAGGGVVYHYPWGDDLSKNYHDGIHIVAPQGNYNVKFLPAMSGTVLHYGSQGVTGVATKNSVLDIQLNARGNNGEKLVLTLKDMDFVAGKYKAGDPINLKNTPILGTVDADEKKSGLGLHVTLMTLKTFNEYIAGRYSAKARYNVPFTQLMNAATDKNSPFKCQ